MATNYTNLLGFALPTTGELAGTWGTVVNDSITELVEDSIAGTATAAVTSGDWTLSTTGSGAANEARCAIIIPTGTPGVSRNVIAPSSSKAYIVINSSNAAVVFKGAATTGVTIGAGDKALVAWNGSDFVRVGASAGGSDTQVQYNSSGNLAGSANLTFDGTTLTANQVSSGQVDITAQGDLRLQDTTGGQYVALQAPGTIASSYTLTLPTTDGDASQVLTTDGSGVLSWTTPSGGVTTFSAGTTGFTPNSATSGAVTLAGTLAVANGGTGQTSFTNGQLLIGNTTGNTLTKATLTAGSGISITNGTGSITIASTGGTSGIGSAIYLATNFGGL